MWKRLLISLLTILAATSLTRAFLNKTPFLQTRVRRLTMVLGSKPNLYIYSHCPFCVRANLIFGLKKIPHQLIFLDNDDVETPTKLVGKKVVPILEMVEANGEVTVMPESMDIVKQIDNDPRWGAPILKAASTREDIKQFFDSIADLSRRCTRPRFAQSSVLPEFRSKSARETFIRNHPLKPPNTDYDVNFNNKALVEELGRRLEELEPLIFSPDFVTEGGESYDDVDFFGKTRGLTVIKGLKIPSKLRAYLQTWSDKTDIPLYYQMQL